VPAPQNDAGIATINLSILNVPNVCSDVGVAAFWTSINSSSSFDFWIEEGITKGRHADGTCGNGVQHYWADRRPNQTYFEHYPGGTVSWNTDYAMRVEYVGGNQWQIKRNGNLVGTSVNAPCCSNALQVGAESHQNSITISGTGTGLQKRIGGTWSYNWPGAFLENTNSFFTLTSSNPTSNVFYYH